LCQCCDGFGAELLAGGHAKAGFFLLGLCALNWHRLAAGVSMQNPGIVQFQLLRTVLSAYNLSRLHGR
jgi:hypothetical protein